MHDMTLDHGALSATALLQAAREVSAAAMATPLAYFRAASAIEQKADETPVTAADRATKAKLHAVIASRLPGHGTRSEEHTSELTSLMRISYDVLSLNIDTSKIHHFPSEVQHLPLKQHLVQ